MALPPIFCDELLDKPAIEPVLATNRVTSVAASLFRSTRSLPDDAGRRFDEPTPKY